jgi:hypothetical protein
VTKALSANIRVRVGAIFDELLEAWKPTADGRLQSSNWNVNFYEAALVQLLDLSSFGLPRVEAMRCAYRALRNALKSEARSLPVFEQELEAEIAAARRKRRSRFTLSTRTFIAASSAPEFEFDLWGTIARFSSDAPEDLRLHDFFLSGHGDVNPNQPEGGLYCVLPIYARSADQAAEQAADHLSEAFGALNFWLNLGTLRWRSGPPEIRATLFPGRDMVICDSRGEMHTESVWFHLDYPQNTTRLSDSERSRIAELEKFSGPLSRVKRADQQFYRDFFRLYFEAISERDTDLRVLRLWKAAEIATFSSSASEIARRLAATWKERELVFAVCFALGHRRNEVMHSRYPGLKLDDVPEIFRQFLEFSVWHSLSSNIDGLAHWRTILELATSNQDLTAIEQALPVAKSLVAR